MVSSTLPLLLSPEISIRDKVAGIDHTPRRIYEMGPVVKPLNYDRPIIRQIHPPHKVKSYCAETRTCLGAV
jgi:hypothetical protein